MSDAPPAGAPAVGTPTARVAGPPGTAKPPGDDDWTVQVADRIESVVGTVRDKTVVPVTKAARAVVFGVLVAVAGIAALVVGLIAAVRLHVYWPFGPEGRKIWVTYAVLSGIFLLLGTFAWAKRSPRAR